MKAREELQDTSQESWVKQWWRPAMAWQYFLVCLFDFFLAPIMMVTVSALLKTPFVPWEPLTLKLSGFYHISMGAIIGIAAWTRGHEKIARLEYDNAAPPTEPQILTEKGEQ